VGLKASVIVGAAGVGGTDGSATGVGTASVGVGSGGGVISCAQLSPAGASANKQTKDKIKVFLNFSKLLFFILYFLLCPLILLREGPPKCEQTPPP
jgi:hypothetical protein